MLLVALMFADIAVANGDFNVSGVTVYVVARITSNSSVNRENSADITEHLLDIMEPLGWKIKEEYFWICQYKYLFLRDTDHPYGLEYPLGNYKWFGLHKKRSDGINLYYDGTWLVGEKEIVNDKFYSIGYVQNLVSDVSNSVRDIVQNVARKEIINIADKNNNFWSRPQPSLLIIHITKTQPEINVANELGDKPGSVVQLLPKNFSRIINAFFRDFNLEKTTVAGINFPGNEAYFIRDKYYAKGNFNNGGIVVIYDYDFSVNDWSHLQCCYYMIDLLDEGKKKLTEINSLRGDITVRGDEISKLRKEVVDNTSFDFNYTEKIDYLNT